MCIMDNSNEKIQGLLMALKEVIKQSSKKKCSHHYHTKMIHRFSTNIYENNMENSF